MVVTFIMSVGVADIFYRVLRNSLSVFFSAKEHCLVQGSSGTGYYSLLAEPAAGHSVYVCRWDPLVFPSCVVRAQVMAHDAHRGLPRPADSHAAKDALVKASALTGGPSADCSGNSGSYSSRLLDRGRGNLYAYEGMSDQLIADAHSRCVAQNDQVAEPALYLRRV